MMQMSCVRVVVGGLAVLTFCLGFTSDADARHRRRCCRQTACCQPATTCCQVAATCNTPAPCATAACAPACAVQQTACCAPAATVQQVSCCGAAGTVQPAGYDQPASGSTSAHPTAPPPPKEINAK